MWKVKVEHLIRFGLAGYRMWVGREEFDGVFATLEKPILVSHKPNSFIDEKAAFMDDSRGPDNNVRGLLQAMCDAAWEIGIYPRQLADHSSELKATKYHLEDMRKLALK